MEQADQLDFLSEEGVYLGKRKSQGLSSLLYSLNDFYIEISYYSYRLNVYSLVTFTDLDNLDPYLPEICLEELDSII